MTEEVREVTLRVGIRADKVAFTIGHPEPAVTRTVTALIVRAGAGYRGYSLQHAGDVMVVYDLDGKRMKVSPRDFAEAIRMHIEREGFQVTANVQEHN